jgi:hypothetical protein
VSKLRNIKRLENKEVKLKSSCEALSKKEAKYKDVIPFTEEIVAFGIGIQELIGLDVGIKEAAKVYNMSFCNSTLRLIEDIKTYNKRMDLDGNYRDYCYKNTHLIKPAQLKVNLLLT